MADKIVRGQLITFYANPKDYLGDAITPEAMKLFLNYKHTDTGATSTDEIEMDMLTDGTWKGEFDTRVCDPGTVFASIRALAPPAADDIKFTITANAANPNDEQTI